MNKFIYPIVLLGLLFSLSFSSKGNDLFQVISSHPHDIEDLTPYVDTVYQNGRLWVVQLKNDAPVEVMEHLKPLEGREKSYLYEGRFIENVTKKSSLGNKIDISSRLLLVSPEAIRNDVIELSNYETRYVGTADNQKATKAVAKRFESMGYKIEEVCYRAGACNIVADKKGSSGKEDVLMIMGHIDSVGEDFAGADDNASGVAVMLEMAKHLKNFPNKKNIRFVVTNGEELGLLGAKHYAKLLSETNKIKNLALVINMDMVGYNSNGIVELETNPKFEAMAKWFADLASRYTVLQTKITLGAWGSDHVPFLDKGVPALLTIEDWDTKTPCYHKVCDKPDTLNYEYASEIAKLNLAAIMTKDLE